MDVGVVCTYSYTHPHPSTCTHVASVLAVANENQYSSELRFQTSFVRSPDVGRRLFSLWTYQTATGRARRPWRHTPPRAGIGGGAQVCLIVEGRAGARTPSSFDTGQRQWHGPRCGACHCWGEDGTRGPTHPHGRPSCVGQATVSNKTVGIPIPTL